MEHIRLVVAIVLSISIFLVWDLVFVDRQPVPPPAPITERVEPETERRDRLENDTIARTFEPLPETTFETISIETDLYQAHISEIGASITRFDLKEYREHSDPGAPRKALIDEGNRLGSALVDFTNSDESLSRAVFSTDFTESSLRVTDAPETISFFWQSDNGLILEKRYTFYPDKYNIDLTLLLRNTSDEIIDRNLEISITNPPPADARTFTFAGPFIYKDQSLNEIRIKDIADQDTYRGEIGWTGIEDQYFLTALIPKTSINTSVLLDLDRRNNLLHVRYQQPVELLRPGHVQEYDYFLFFGPKKLSILADFGYDLNEVVNFGFFSFLSKPALWLLNMIHDNIIANYGVAIIMITLLIKAVFWPLGNKSYKSMAEMRRLQPLMVDIRNKYKDDKRKMNEEVMNLYKTYKINPLSGCLPMIVQIPVFIAFYRMLYEAIELRHASFIFWMQDLSAPDRLFNFNFSIPFMAEPTGIPILTIIMGATMFLQQKLAPPPGDPMQARIMMMLPLVFTIIFINFPAGLVLYWLVNNVVSVAQQYNINRKMI